jgi:hypothetical protein
MFRFLFCETNMFRFLIGCSIFTLLHPSQGNNHLRLALTSADPLHLERKWPSQFLFFKIRHVAKQTLTVQIYFVHHFVIFLINKTKKTSSLSHIQNRFATHLKTQLISPERHRPTSPCLSSLITHPSIKAVSRRFTHDSMASN